MPTTIAIDDMLIEEALKLSNIRTKKDLIKTALEEFIHNRKTLNLQNIKGKINFRDDYDYKEMRSR